MTYQDRFEVRTALLLGTWQGLYLWEHRTRSHLRAVVVTVTGEG